MGIVEDFVGRYRREYDFYDQAARLVHQAIDARLQAAGVRAIVTYRAKAAGRVEPKVRDRARKRGYTTVEEIYDDIADLAGVRVALYFPAQRMQVGVIVRELFVVLQEKEFPDGSPSKYKKRFAGYSATHYRVRLRDTLLIDAQKRYAEARVEIQVGSVLMHAWAEVEHDLVYKPLQGALSEDEYAILDELNGVVMAGEIALERLQRAGDVRVSALGRHFSTHYDLASYLLSKLKDLADSDALQSGLGRVDLLYDLLDRLNMATPEGTDRHLKALHSDLEIRPISEQIVDQLLAEDPARYALYEAVRAARPAADAAPEAAEPPVPDTHKAMGEFLSAWIELERRADELFRKRKPQSPRVFPFQQLRLLFEKDPDAYTTYQRLRRVRNNIVHGVEIPTATELVASAREAEGLREKLQGTT